MTRRFALAFAAGLLAVTSSARGGDADVGLLSPATPVCTAGAMPSGTADSHFALAGWPDRDYDLVLPASYQCGTPIAVAIVFHGGGGNKEGMRKIACPDGDLASAGCLHRLALAAGIAVVFANGTNTPGSKLINPKGLRTWNAGGGQQGAICVSGHACTRGIDDVAYARALVADLAGHVAVDAKRVFATGFSNGAALSQRLACEAADLFAAIAPVSGENQFALVGCSPTQPVAVLDIHGTLDKCWPYRGGMGGCIQSGRYVSVEFTLAGWATRNGCNAVASPATLPARPGASDGTSVVRHAWSGCAAGGALEHLEVVGNGHYWPSGHEYARNAMLGGVMSRQLDTGQAIVDFFIANGRP